MANPLPFKYWMLSRLSNDFEASRSSTKRPISLATTLVTRLSKYVSKRLESCTSRRRKQSWWRIMLQADRILPEKRKVKKFLCTNSLLELVTCYCKRSQRSVVSERRIRARQVYHQVLFASTDDIRSRKVFLDWIWCNHNKRHSLQVEKFEGFAQRLAAARSQNLTDANSTVKQQL